MGSEVSEAKERQLLQAIHGLSADTPEEEQEADAAQEYSRKRKAQEAENGDDADAGGEKRGVLQTVGDILSQSANSVKEAVLGSGQGHQADKVAGQNNSTPVKQDAGLMDSAAQESLLVHAVVHD